jgi:hypothetical protein
MRITRNVPHTEKEDHECKAKETSKKDSWGLKIEPILSNRPEQDDAYQKSQEIGNCW